LIDYGQIVLGTAVLRRQYQEGSNPLGFVYFYFFAVQIEGEVWNTGGV
jgi:hypothetical protein